VAVTTGEMGPGGRVRAACKANYVNVCGACACVVKLSMVSISLFGINISGVIPIQYPTSLSPRLNANRGITTLLINYQNV
jgi:hypothetical protein